MIRYIQFEADEFRYLGDWIVYNKEELFCNRVGSTINLYNHIIYPAIDLRIIIKGLHGILVNIYENTGRIYECINNLTRPRFYYKQRLIRNFSDILVLNGIVMERGRKVYKILINYLKKTRKYTNVDTHRLALTHKNRLVFFEFLEVLLKLERVFNNTRYTISTDCDEYPNHIRAQLKSLSSMLKVGEHALRSILNSVLGTFDFATNLHTAMRSPRIILHSEGAGIFNYNYIGRFRLKLRCYSHIERNKIKEEFYNVEETFVL